MNNSSQTKNRPGDATYDGLRVMMEWLDECRKIGWSEDSMKDLESLFWRYHNKDGTKKDE